MKCEYITGNENFEITNLRMIFVHKKQDLTPVKRKRNMETLLYMLDGKIRVQDENSGYDFVAEKGDLIYIPSGENNVITHTGEVNRYLVIRFESCTGKLLGDAVMIKDGTDEKINTTAENLVFQLENHREKNHTYFCMLTYQLLCNVLEFSIKTQKQKFQKLIPVIDEMRAHPEVDRKISDYADMCLMSEVGFRKLFIEYMGKTPVAYRTELRLKMAEDMLIDGEYSVAEAATLSGFHSMSFFCREFKKYYGYNAGSIK